MHRAVLARGALSAGVRRLSASPSPVTPRAASFSKWYLSIVASAELTDATSPVKGCAILRPSGFALWASIRDQLDARIAAAGALNAYFPLLIPSSFLSREAAHVEGFAKECAVVTHHRLRSKEGGGVEVDPAARLLEPYVIRPTSETVIWDAFSRWITSHRDLPLLINQWANVVRWEMRTRPFLRTTEFLWQEGHTAHASAAEANAYAQRMQLMYSTFLADVLAIPHVIGAKSSSERFAGADATLTCEAMMANGWALQAATSHSLGQSFSKAFGVTYTDAAGARIPPWGTSWGASTRLIGGLIMTHSDDTGLVLPPAVAPTQVVVLPLLGKGGQAGGGAPSIAAAESLVAALKAAGIRAVADLDVSAHPGSRFYAWERRGVPLRIEIGPRELAAGSAAVKPRVPVPGIEGSVPLLLEGAGPDSVASAVSAVRGQLAAVQARLYASALARTRANIVLPTAFSELAEHAVALERGSAAGEDCEEGGLGASAAVSAARGKFKAAVVAPYAPPSHMFLAPWCDDAAAEAAVKAATKYTIRCFPAGGEALGTSGADPQAAAVGATCFYSGRPATHMALFARAF
jgi:prolyl-tRNA synthetase